MHWKHKNAVNYENNGPIASRMIVCIYVSTGIIVFATILSMGRIDLFKSHSYWWEYLMPYNSKLFVLRILTWCYNCLLRIIIISSLKPTNCVQTNDYYQTEIISWNHLIIIIR